MRSLVVGDWEEAANLLAEYGEPADAEGQAWTADRLKALAEAYRMDHRGPRLDSEGRNLRHTYVLPDWRVQQMLVDEAGDNDWVAEFQVDLEASRKAGAPVMSLARLGSYR